MALAQRKLMRFMINRITGRYYSADSQTKKSVFISQSTDVYTNLALEDWLYKNFDFTNHHVLMLWRNNPCVVIGRHQNPWQEANVANLGNITESGVSLARRNSGGGTVYHDQGNLNLTFFTPKEHYCRKYNLEIIRRGIFREYGVTADISPREDLTILNKKISGTAAKLGSLKAYHHCTLLVHVNKLDLSQALQKHETGIVSNATKSIKSEIMNLSDENPRITVDGLLSAIGWEYLRTTPYSLVDGGKELANRQNGFQMINPTESWFPGINEIRDHLISWEWCYGKTPKFSITHSFPIPPNLLNNMQNINEDLRVTVIVENGRVIDVTLFVPQGLSNNGFSGEAKVITTLKNHKFSEEALNLLEWSIGGRDSGSTGDKDKFVTECVRQVMTSV